MFKKLAEAISVMDEGDELQFRINDNSTGNKELDVEIILGVKIVYELDSKLAIIGAYGGGFNSVIWLNDFTDVEEINDHLEIEFKEVQFVGLG